MFSIFYTSVHYKQGWLLRKTKPHRIFFVFGCIVTKQKDLVTPGKDPSSKKEKGKGKREKDNVSCLFLTRAFGLSEDYTLFMASF